MHSDFRSLKDHVSMETSTYREKKRSRIPWQRRNSRVLAPTQYSRERWLHVSFSFPVKMRWGSCCCPLEHEERGKWVCFNTLLLSPCVKTRLKGQAHFRILEKTNGCLWITNYNSLNSFDNKQLSKQFWSSTDLPVLTWSRNTAIKYCDLEQHLNKTLET